MVTGMLKTANKQTAKTMSSRRFMRSMTSSNCDTTPLPVAISLLPLFVNKTHHLFQTAWCHKPYPSLNRLMPAGRNATDAQACAASPKSSILLARLPPAPAPLILNTVASNSEPAEPLKSLSAATRKVVSADLISRSPCRIVPSSTPAPARALQACRVPLRFGAPTLAWKHRRHRWLEISLRQQMDAQYSNKLDPPGFSVPKGCVGFGFCQKAGGASVQYVESA